jgi:flagellar biogenesis protein FliO
MLAGFRLRKWILSCLLAAVVVSNARAQTSNPPSGAVRSHYTTGVSPVPQNTAPPVTAPQYNPAYQPGAVAPVVLEQPAALPPRELAPSNAVAVPLPLSPRGSPAGKALLRTPTSGWGALSSVGASLSLVIAAFICVAWLSKRYLPKTAGPLPKEVVEQLGWAPLAGRQQMQLVRIGNKLLLLAVTPGSNVEPLAEVTEPAEVERLSALCRRTKSDSTTHSFREVISELERQPARGFVEAAPRTAAVARPATAQTTSTPVQARPIQGRPLHG